MCSSLKQCAEGKILSFRLKVKVTLEGQMFEPAFCVQLYLTHSLKDFHETWLKCLSSQKQCANGKIKSFWPKVKVTLFKWLGALVDFNLSYRKCEAIEHKAFLCLLLFTGHLNCL